MALVFARALCQPDRADVRLVSSPADMAPNSDDALRPYAPLFHATGMSNTASGVDTLRHSYVLLIGLGMTESSGRYCEGRDVSACFTSANSAEAGLFQTSFGAHRFSSSLPAMTQRYMSDRSGCMLNTFKGPINCRVLKSHNPTCPKDNSDVAGSGPGADWQRLTKACPAFATEYAAVLLRTHGGNNGEFNPIRKLEAEVRPECDGMLHNVQAFVEEHRGICSKLSTE